MNDYLRPVRFVVNTVVYIALSLALLPIFVALFFLHNIVANSEKASGKRWIWE